MKTRTKVLIIGVSVLLAVLVGVGIVGAQSGWFVKIVPTHGTITITTPPTTTTTTTTTTPPPPAANYDYTITPGTADFGSTSFACGAPVSVTFDVTVANTGDQPIHGLTITPTNLPAWLTAAITQTPVAAGASATETITISGTAPASPATVTFLGPSVLSSITLSILPN